MLEQTKLLDIKQRICYNVLILIFKAKNQLLPSYLSRYITTVGESQPYMLRNHNYLRPIQTTSAINQNSLMYKGVLLFNDMLREIRNVNSLNLNVFKRQAMTFVKNNCEIH